LLRFLAVQGISQAQAVHAAVHATLARCRRVLGARDASLDSIRAVLRRRDEQYMRLLLAQSEETEALIAALHQHYDRLRAAQEAELGRVEAAYLGVGLWHEQRSTSAG
jgi:hypothetical protein